MKGKRLKEKDIYAHTHNQIRWSHTHTQLTADNSSDLSVSREASVPRSWSRGGGRIVWSDRSPSSCGGEDWMFWFNSRSLPASPSWSVCSWVLMFRLGATCRFVADPVACAMRGVAAAGPQKCQTNKPNTKPTEREKAIAPERMKDHFRGK